MLLRKINAWVVVFAVLATANMLMKHWLIISDVLAEGESVITELFRFYGFFTNIANLICCLFFISLALPNSWIGQIAKWRGIRSAMLTYMTIVAVVYHLLLSGLWAPEGLTRIADVMFHTVVPIWVFLIWAGMGETARVPVKNIFAILILPGAYLAYSLIRGAFIDYYPYFFLNVSELGYSGVALNSLFLLIAFLGLGFLFVSIANLRHRPGQRE